jgi:hypothetical protein
MAPRPNPVDSAGIPERRPALLPHLAAAGPADYLLARFAIRDLLASHLLMCLRTEALHGGPRDPSSTLYPTRDEERAHGRLMEILDLAIGLFDADREEVRHALNVCRSRTPHPDGGPDGQLPLWQGYPDAARSVLQAALLP